MNKSYPIFNVSEMKCPRLELRWDKVDGNDKECAYNLVIPLTEYDIRREDSDGKKVRDCLTVEMGRTQSSGGSPVIFDGDKNNPPFIRTPFRDGAHIRWDGKVLNLPIYVVFEDKAQELEMCQ